LLKRLNNILDELEESTDKAIALAESFEVKGDTLDKIIEFFATLKKDRQGNFERSIDNLKAVDKFRAKLTEYIGKDSDYINKELSKVFESNGKFINLYFSEMVNGYEASKQIYSDIRALSIYQTASVLKGSEMEASISEPIIRILKENIKAGTNFPNLRKLLINEILGDKEKEPYIKRYIKQVTNDAVMTYNRSYMNAISEDLDIKHYLYRGTKIADTRSYCQSRAGKVFTKKEIEDSASLDWSGKRKGTNKENIFIFAGGYNCRHDYIPITVEIYNTLK
jgi:hypothetical protein